MPKFNADEKIFEPIEITIKGTNHVIKSITPEMIKEVGAIGNKGVDEEDSEVLYKQLAIFTGAKPEEFKGVDVRSLSAALNFIQNSIRDQIQDSSKNG